jgi:Outer membrane protein beta-barrel domain
MRKITLLLIIVVIGISSNSFAQRFGVKGGLNITNLKVENHDYSPKLGFHFGPITEIPLGDIFAIETGVLLSTKGAKSEETFFGITTQSKTNLLYLDFPINAKAGYDFGKTRVYGILGPYFAFGLSGKYKTKIDDGGNITKSDTKIEWGSDGSLKRFDSGLTIGACAAVSIFELGFSYSHGFVNISSNDEHKTKNRVFSISMAYKFGENPFKR